MRILFFVPRECRPTNTGAKLRNYFLCREMARVAHVTYLSFADEKSAPFLDNREGDELAERIVRVPKGGISPFKIARGLLGPQSFTVLNYTTPDMQEQLTRILREEDFDAVQVEGLVLAGYLPILRAAPSKPKLVCDWHNVDSELIGRYAEHAPDPFRAAYARLTSRRLKKLERDTILDFDAHLTVSDRDREFVQSLNPKARAFTIENGTDTTSFQHGLLDGAAANAPHRIVFVGSMDYHPNNDAALFFAREVWPLVYAKRPHWTFTVVGRDPSPAVIALAELPGVEVTGTVPDVRPYYREAVASVVPLRIAGGSRLKITEGMAARVPIVSTTLGAEGLAVRDGETILLRDTPAALAEALVGLDTDPNREARLEAAYQLAVTRYDWKGVANTLRGVYEQLLDRPIPAAREEVTA